MSADEKRHAQWLQKNAPQNQSVPQNNEQKKLSSEETRAVIRSWAKKNNLEPAIKGGARKKKLSSEETRAVIRSWAKKNNLEPAIKDIWEEH